MSSNRYIYGIHDHGGEHLLAGRGWVVFTEELGADPSDMAGGNYQRYADQGLGVIVRLNFGYGAGAGTIPTPDKYDAFARRCANFVANSPGIEWVVIGNEIALHWEQPVIGQQLTLATYVDCYRRCYDAIKAVMPQAKIAPAAVAPWNDSTPDAPDWIDQLRAMLVACRCDWICLHAYTRGYDPGSFTTGAKMDNPAYSHRYNGWETLYEFMRAIPSPLRYLPVMVTEVNGNAPWSMYQPGWVQALYEQIDRWNATPGNQQIRCAALFRWATHDTQWDMSRYSAVHDDLRVAVGKGYQWRNVEPPQVLPAPQWTGYVAASPHLRLRAEPNTTSNVLANVELGKKVNVIGERAGWLNVVYGALTGWMAKAWVSSNAPVVNDESTEDQRSDRDAIITKLAAEYGVDERVARAVLKIESGGSGYRDGRLVIRFEPHVFKERLNALFDEYFKVGNPAWEGKQHQYNDDGNWRFFHGVQEQEYNALEVALVVARCAAFDSASYGAGQILGLNHEKVGYGSAEAMMAAFQNSEEAQLRAMFEFFKNSRGSDGRTAIECLRSGDFLAFAKIYNGNANARHYSRLIQDAMM